jgi:hypothetical protein
VPDFLLSPVLVPSVSNTHVIALWPAVPSPGSLSGQAQTPRLRNLAGAVEKQILHLLVLLDTSHLVRKLSANVVQIR